MTEVQNGLHLDWEHKFDEKSGRHYYVHHYSRTTTWDDPRTKQRDLKSAPNNWPTEHNPQMQAHNQHRSPDIRRNSVHPNHSTPPIEAFLSNSVPLKETKTVISRSPLKLRSAKVQDASLPPSNSLDDSVSKIGAMFPTVSETHIRLLLKKYLNREALVISALQVEKYPITTPGPFSTPPPQRNIQVNVKESSSRAGSPFVGTRMGFQGFRSAGNIHSSPKLKLRYMKSIFPNADETLILDCLQNNENSIQQTSERLEEMGYSRKEIVKPVAPNVKLKTVDSVEAETERLKSPVIPIRTKSAEEKEKVKRNLKENYDDVPEHLICMALESVNFDERRATEILKIMKEEDSEMQSKRNALRNSTSETDASRTSSNPKCQIPTTQSRQSLKSLLKSEKRETNTNRFSRIIDKDNPDYQTDNLCNTQGHNVELSKGPNDKLLLENYVQWQGRNKSFAKGPRGLSQGANPGLLMKKVYKPCGPNSNLRNGPACGLAKGSIFAQVKALIVGESRID